MVKLRLKRTGKKKHPSYQIVAIDNSKKRDGSYLEKIGHYYPLIDKYNVNEDKALKWLNFGAQPTEIVKNIFKKTKVMFLYKQQKEISKNIKKE